MESLFRVRVQYNSRYCDPAGPGAGSESWSQAASGGCLGLASGYYRVGFGPASALWQKTRTAAAEPPRSGRAAPPTVLTVTVTVASPAGPAPGPGRPAPSQPGSVGHAGVPSQLSPTRSLSPSHRLWPPGLAHWPGPGIAPAAPAGESTWQVQCWRAARRRRHCPGRRDRASGLTAAVSGNPGGVGDCGPQCPGPARAGHGDSAAAWPVTGWLRLAGQTAGRWPALDTSGPQLPEYPLNECPWIPARSTVGARLSRAGQIYLLIMAYAMRAATRAATGGTCL